MCVCVCVYIYIYIHTVYIYIYTYIHRDGSRFSNIRLVDLILEYRLGCAILFFSKGVPGLDNKDCTMA